ncbi:TRIO and F-actin-binding protein-like [Genypterus blacodes]|uniref:TRIO and F-actin-binding protein-like n=1 Tax=Genypterus blacodes TaxID=154954 RepID=UPI003F76BE52
MTPDLLNFKKGWMSKLDQSGEWKKHWFVLTDAGLRYYRDAGAEEKDDLDGEIDLKSCTKVSEFDVEKNYGFQIQTQEAVITLSAMTAGIRRNWIEVLKKCVRPSTSPDVTKLPDSNSDKENSHTRSFLSSRRSSSHHSDVQSVVLTSPHPTPVSASSSTLSASQSTDREWAALLCAKTTGVGSNQKICTEEEIEKRWSEFERMPLKERRSLPPMGKQTSSQSANGALLREVASLRQQLEKLQHGGGGVGGGGGGGGVGGVIGGCGPGPEASCGRSLLSLERTQRQTLEELQKKHDRQIKELEMERDRLLREETQATAQVMEALKKVHKDELESEMEKVRRLSGMVDSQTSQTQQQAETQALQRELAGLSERYSQKCLELNRAEQSNSERQREISSKEKDMEHLKKENQDLKTRLMVEIRGIMSKGSDDRSDRMPCELEVLLMVKENEIDYLHKEISCLRNELQFLNTEKRLACKRYKEVHEELCGIKGRSEREIQNLKEHLRLAMAALQEGQTLGNSLDH